MQGVKNCTYHILFLRMLGEHILQQDESLNEEKGRYRIQGTYYLTQRNAEYSQDDYHLLVLESNQCRLAVNESCEGMNSTKIQK